MGRCKSLGSLTSFLSYASQLSGPISCIFLHPELLCSPEGVAADVATRSLQLPGCPQGSEIHIWRAEITDDPDILVYWYGRKYSIFSIPYPKDSIYNHKLEFWSPTILCKTFPHLSFQMQNAQELGSYFTHALINFPEVSRPGLPYTVAIRHMLLNLNSLKLNIIQSPVAQSHWSHFKCPTTTCGSDWLHSLWRYRHWKRLHHHRHAAQD